MLLLLLRKKANRFFSGTFCAFLRVALKDLHHTREAMSTAKSIRVLSVHKIAQNMKPDSIKTTHNPQHEVNQNK